MIYNRAEGFWICLSFRDHSLSRRAKSEYHDSQFVIAVGGRRDRGGGGGGGDGGGGGAGAAADATRGGGAALPGEHTGHPSLLGVPAARLYGRGHAWADSAFVSIKAILLWIQKTRWVVECG
jgi:hypothetical protein